MPSFVLISVDDMRFDAFAAETDTRYLDRSGLAGIRRTPALDALAARGARFSHAFTTCPYTPPAHASMFTGLYPVRHGVRAFMTNGLSEQVPTIATHLQKAGFRTVASIDMAPMFALLGLTAGFDRVVHLDDAATFAAIGEATEGGAPVFLFAHFEDVHPPVGESLAPPEPGYNDDFYEDLAAMCDAFGIAYDRDAGRAEAIAASGRLRKALENRRQIAAVELPRYLAGVNKFDSGRLALFFDGLWNVLDPDDTVIMLTSDHGQGVIPSHRMVDRSIPQKFDHGEAVLDELLRVPLIVAGPGIPAGLAPDAAVSLVDLVPTILEMAGVVAEPDLDGRSLAPVFRHEEIEPSSAYAEVWYHDRAELSSYLRASVAAGGLLAEGYRTTLHEQTVRAGNMKLVATPDGPMNIAVADGPRAVPSLAIYDVDRDPYEEVDLLAQSVALESAGLPGLDARSVASLRAELARIAHLTIEPEANAASVSPGSEDLAEIEDHLRTLGYVD